MFKNLEALGTVSETEGRTETHIERAVDDLGAREFVLHFFSPHRPDDSLDYMARELVTLKQGEDLQAHREAVQVLLEDSNSRQAIEGFVHDDYELKSQMEEREELHRKYGRRGASMHRHTLKELLEVDFQALKSFCGAIEKAQAVDSESSLLGGLKDLALSIAEEENYQIARAMVEAMENYGEGAIHVRYDYFDTVMGVEHIRMNPKERWKEMLHWYLHTGKVGLEMILSMGLAYLFPVHREVLLLKTLEFLVEENSDSMQSVLEQRQKMDFLLGAPKYVEKIKSHGLPLTFPQFSESSELIVSGLYNPLLLLQRDKEKRDNIVANDVESKPELNTAIITGPNNTGKSVYVKSIGLTCGLAHNGFPVPAREAHMGELDGLYTHFVHPEDIRLGEGSFLDELRRIGEVFQNATSRTLIIVDEPIRGSSPEDSEEIALWYIEGFIALQAPTFLTTHFHSVAKKVEGWDGVRSLQTEVRVDGGDIVPSYKIIPGIAGKSYGVEIARQSGLSRQDILDMVRQKPGD